jgi:hypothetical protein
MRANSEIDDRVHDEFPILIADANDRSDFEHNSRLKERRRRTVPFKIYAIKEIALCRIRRDKEIANFESVRQEFSRVANGERSIKAQLPPLREAIGQFRRPIKAKGLWSRAYKIKPDFAVRPGYLDHGS